MLLTISQNSQENTFIGVSFVITLESSRLSLYEERSYITSIFCKFCETFKMLCFVEYQRTAASVNGKPLFFCSAICLCSVIKRDWKNNCNIVSIESPVVMTNWSSRSQMFFKIGVLKHLAIFTENHLCLKDSNTGFF